MAPNDKHEGPRAREEDAVPPLMDIPALALRLSVPERHIRRLVAEHRIPFLKWGHLVRFDPRQVEEWLAAAQVPARHIPALKVGRPGRRGGAGRPVGLTNAPGAEAIEPGADGSRPTAGERLWRLDTDDKKTG